MVQVKLSNEILSIRGRFGGVYFKTGKPGQHIQAMPRIVKYTRSPLQTQSITGYSGAACFWIMALVAYFALDWAVFGASYLFAKPGKKAKRISGYCWYIHYALTFPETDEPHFWGPPHSPYDLPDYVCSSGTTWHLRYTPSEFPSDYPGGYYWKKEEWNGKPFYRTDDMIWCLWWDDTRWALSLALGEYIENFTYYSPGDKIWDWYQNPDTGKRVHVYIGKHE